MLVPADPDNGVDGVDWDFAEVVHQDARNNQRIEIVLIPVFHNPLLLNHINFL